jgi:hypothetical protein
MRASGQTFLPTSPAIFLARKRAPEFRRARALTALILMSWFVAAASGCATKGAYAGHYATDLSFVKPGLSRTTIESAIGTPDKAERHGKAVEVRYLIDRGFVGTLEENSVGEKILWAPVMAWGEFVSLGLAGWMVACATPCQKGWLVVVYDEYDRVDSASESFLPDEHPIVADCARSAVRADLAVCRGVRERVRPSSLPVGGESTVNGGLAEPN